MQKTIHAQKSDLRQYMIVTGNYWAFTLTDGALRMLVVLHFYQLGYSPLELATLFLLYEFFGVLTNLVGGWLGARLGLNHTMNFGLALQLFALGMLLVPDEMLSVVWVMVAQAISGIAKDFNKMSAKSSIKLLLPENQESRLFKWVSILTGSKNALKGIGFFAGGALLAWLGFRGAIATMMILLAVVFCASLILLKADLGKSSHKPKFRQIFSPNKAINLLAAARCCLFGARDIWFVVALPVFLSSTLNWSHAEVGSFFASWIIAYGLVQSLTPKLYSKGLLTKPQGKINSVKPTPDGRDAFVWAIVLCLLTISLAAALFYITQGGQGTNLAADVNLESTASIIERILVIGLLCFGVVFAINSSLHSFLIVSYADSANVSMDVGFYYMANAMGRLIGTVLSGYIYQEFGLLACLLGSSILLIGSILISTGLSRRLE